MTGISRQTLFFLVIHHIWWVLALLLPALPAHGQTLPFTELVGHKVVSIELVGANRTNHEWLINYLGVPLPITLTDEDAVVLEKRVMTTGAFTSAQVTFVPNPVDPNTRVLRLTVDEKWTLIPVVRGVYGGGTPLWVLGGYDIHAGGRLWTIGAEARKYGDASPGYVLYFRDPRHAGGRFFLGGEVWKMRRVRTVYGEDAKEAGDLVSETAIARLNALFPFTFEGPVKAGEKFAWKYGLDLRWSEDQPVTVAAHDGFDSEDLSQADPGLPTSVRSSTRLLPTLLYDDVDSDSLNMDGLRVALKAGAIAEKSDILGVSEIEVFQYKLLTSNFNLASHLFFGSVSEDRFEHRYFLGGFDSVRGLPDGYLAGTRAAYGNFEARYVVDRSKYLHTQAVMFFDAGGAADSWAKLGGSSGSAIGGGVRLAIPQVYRLMFRIDYAVSLGEIKTQGITAGLNQFFDPYIPL